MTGPEIFDAGFKIFGAGLGVWALKAYIERASKTPDASSGFLTLESIEKHCRRVQTGCIDRIETKLKALGDSVDGRLKTGDRVMEDHEQRLRSIQNDLTKQIENLKTVQENNAKKVAVEIVNLLKKKKG